MGRKEYGFLISFVIDKYLVSRMADTPTKSALNKKKVAELRGELTELGLATNGIKADLVQV